MQYTVNLNSGNRRTLKGGQQNTTQGVAQCHAKSAFQRLSNHSGETEFVVARRDFELGWLDQFLPVFLNHVSTLSCFGRCPTKLR